MTLLLLSSCKGMRDKLDDKLYAKADVSIWLRDSLLVENRTPVLFRVLKKGNNQYILPIATLRAGAPKTLQMTKRGWSKLDIEYLYSGREVTPVRDGVAGPTIRTSRGMWENPSAPLDTLPGCNSPLPLGLISAPAGTQLVVAHYKLPSSVKQLSAGEVQAAISQVPLLVTPSVHVPASELASFSRTVRQIPRVGLEPAIFLEYHDSRPDTDTSAVAMRRPKHLLIVLEKGVYTYRPSWVYVTTGRANDKPMLRFLDVMDADMDGKAELFFQYETAPGFSYTMMYRQNNDTWQEAWRRSPARCDVL